MKKMAVVYKHDTERTLSNQRDTKDIWGEEERRVSVQFYDQVARWSELTKSPLEIQPKRLLTQRETHCPEINTNYEMKTKLKKEILYRILPIEICLQKVVQNIRVWKERSHNKLNCYWTKLSTTTKLIVSNRKRRDLLICLEVLSIKL